MNKYILGIFVILFFVSSCRVTKNVKHTIDNSDELSSCDSLAFELCQLFALDQGIRERSIINDAQSIMYRVDSMNYTKLISLIKRYGFPSKGNLKKYKHCECVNMAAVAILLHNPQRIINNREDFNLLLNEVKKGNLSKEGLAFILDKHYWATSGGKYVMYGSQLGVPCISTKDTTNFLRQEIGLKPLPDSLFVVCE